MLPSTTVTEYNEVRLHSALGYVTPIDKLYGREKAIFAERDRKLKEARERRAANRQLSNQEEQPPTQAGRCYTQ